MLSVKIDEMQRNVKIARPSNDETSARNVEKRRKTSRAFQGDGKNDALKSGRLENLLKSAPRSVFCVAPLPGKTFRLPPIDVIIGKIGSFSRFFWFSLVKILAFLGKREYHYSKTDLFGRRADRSQIPP